MYRIYEVKSGETLASIANKLNTTAETLATINGLSSNINLIPGTYIVVPNEETSFSRYTIQKNDNIYQIAQMYNTTEANLLKLNGLNANDYIYPGEEIIVPNQNIKFYITEEGDTLNKVINNLKTTADKLNNENSTIYLTADQLVISQK